MAPKDASGHGQEVIICTKVHLHKGGHGGDHLHKVSKKRVRFSLELKVVSVEGQVKPEVLGFSEDEVAFWREKVGRWRRLEEALNRPEKKWKTIKTKKNVKVECGTSKASGSNASSTPGPKLQKISFVAKEGTFDLILEEDVIKKMVRVTPPTGSGTEEDPVVLEEDEEMEEEVLEKIRKIMTQVLTINEQ